METDQTEVFMATRAARFRRLVSAGLISAAAGALVAVPQSKAPEACPAIDPPAETAVAVPGGAGLRVFVDPATGRIRRPTLEERRRIAATKSAARDRSGRAYEIRTRRDGTRIVKLDEAFLMSVVARTNPDGTVSYVCRTEPSPAAGSVESAK
jgi:hypothetical protein